MRDIYGWPLAIALLIALKRSYCSHTTAKEDEYRRPKVLGGRKHPRKYRDHRVCQVNAFAKGAPTFLLGPVTQSYSKNSLKKMKSRT